MGVRANQKLRKVVGGAGIKPALISGDVRPGGWKSMLVPADLPGSEHKGRHVPVPLDDKIVQEIADGRKASEIEDELTLQRGYVRTVLIRRFGSVEGMKKALQAQCLENAIALNEYAIDRIQTIPAGQALVGAKIMIDGALALEKSRVDRPSTVDFAVLAALGGVIERVEKVILGTDRTV